MDFLELFQEYMRDEEKSEKTIESYVIDIKQFLNFINKDITEVTKEDIRNFKDYLNSESRKVRTINRKLASISQYINYLNNEHKLNIYVRIKQEKTGGEDALDDMLEIEHAIRIVRAAEKVGDIRAVTIFLTLFYTGARVSEMLKIKVEDIVKDSFDIKGKGSKTRPLYIPDKLKAQWKKYNEVRDDTSEYLFTGTRGPINRQTVHNIIKFYTGQARGINKEWAHAHAFRHLYARELKNLGINMATVAQLLGHSFTVTASYMKDSRRDLLKIVNKLDLKINEEEKKKKTAKKNS